jgi:hypothetical protein
MSKPNPSAEAVIPRSRRPPPGSNGAGKQGHPQLSFHHPWAFVEALFGVRFHDPSGTYASP